MKDRCPRLFVLLLIALCATMAASVLLGSVRLNWQLLPELIGMKLQGVALDGEYLALDRILFALRVPRTLLMLLTGAALATSGASYQGLFRNPLADPYLIGIASGAGLGAVIAMNIPWVYTRALVFVTPLFAFVFATLTVVIVFRLGTINGVLSTSGLILAGAAMNALCSALTSLLMLMSDHEVRHTLSWMLGGVTQSGNDAIVIGAPLIMLGMLGQFALAYPLNVMQFGDEQASQLGISVHKMRILIIFFATLTTATAISFSGVIGFVGLIIPHAMRLLAGTDYRRLIPLCALAGGAFMMFSDILARLLIAPQELPVGIITALAGAPFFLWLLKQRAQNGL